MKKILLAGLLAAPVFLPPLSAQTGRIEVRVEGIRNDKGQIGVLLFGQATGFPRDDKASLRQALVEAKEGAVSVVFDDVPYGTYAVTVMHDENGNLKVDTNLLGIPKEGYGVSNNVRNLLRAPRFGEAAFELKQARLPLRISLIY